MREFKVKEHTDNGYKASTLRQKENLLNLKSYIFIKSRNVLFS